MARASRSLFTTIKTEGGLLPPDFLQRLVEGDKKIDGLTPESYHLTGGEKPNEAASRSWNRLQTAWATFQTASNGLRAEDAGTGLTREKWLLPLFNELGYGRLQAARTFEIDGKPYPISHLWQLTPIHLVGRNVELDRRSPGVIGAAKTTPHGLMQEFLNRHEGHLWGFVSNGLKLRILRDNKSLTRQAYVEFDLAGMMDGQVYSDFAVLFLLCHQSRVEAERAEQCWLEKWADAAREQGTRALDQLREGVEKAIKALGRGFLAQPANKELVESLRSGALDKQDYYRQLLRTVYRLIFLFVSEDRDLLLTAPHGSKERKRYLDHYSASRLRTLAEHRRGTPHPDLWQALRLIFARLSSDTGCPELGLPALGSFLWSDKATPDLDRCELSNGDLLGAVRSLAFTLEGKIRRAIDYRNLGAEELGSVYESLLELHPDVNADAPTFDLKVAVGHERKTTGSYYTPTSLIECLLDSALEPVLQAAAKQPNPEQAILDLKVCDPACGSGHFLIAAAHRIANRLAAARTGDEEPSPEAVRKALRDIVGRCLYGVDINPMAVELCKVNLWLEALEPSRPLSVLEHHIQCGNSLLGATPELIAGGLSDRAFVAIEDDDKKACKVLKNRNEAERRGAGPLFAEEDTEGQARLQQTAAALDGLPDGRFEDVRAKELALRRYRQSPAYETKKQLADVWCAAFIIRKYFTEPGRDGSASGITQGHLYGMIAGRSLPDVLAAETERISGQHRLLHWHLDFPDVLARRGFDCVLGNPPWGATVADRVKELIRVRLSSVRRGTLDTFAAFTEHSLSITRPGGRVGLVLPDILLLKNYPDLRLHLLERASLQQIAHWGQAFPDASIDVCTIVASAGAPEPGHTIDCIPAVDRGQLAVSLHHAIRQDVFINNKDHRFNLQLSPEKESLIAEMRALGPRIGELFLIREGVHSGNVRDRLFLDHAEGEHCHPLIFGRDEIQPMRLRWGGKFIQLDQSRFDRVAGDYFNLGDPTLYARPKLLVRRTGDFVLAAPDLEGRFCSNNFFILVPRSPMETHQLFYAAAALNSGFSTLFFRTIQPRTGKLFAELKITHLEEIPIPFFADALADEQGRLLSSSDEGSRTEAAGLDGFRERLLARIRDGAPHVASAMESENA